MKITICSRTWFTLFSGLISFASIQSQNLVPDGGFEILKSSTCQDPDNSFSRLKEWYVLDASPDLFVGNCTYEDSDFVFWDSESKPYEGLNFIGLWSRWNSNNTYFSEGIATRLSSPLIAGEMYLVQLMVRNRGGYQGLDDSVSGCSLNPEKHIDIYTYDDSIKIENNFSNGTATTSADLVASLQSESISGGSNDNWSVSSTCFTANGDERYIGIVMPLGTFGELPACAAMASSGVFRSFYFQLDAVSVTLLAKEYTSQIEKCEMEVMEIDVRDYFDFEFKDNTEFLWDDGFRGALREITQVRDYDIEAITDCGSIDLILNVEMKNCSRSVYVPNVFTPDRETNNKLAIGLGNNVLLSQYELRIFNRWGELVFTSRDPQISWNGTYNGERAPVGTYVLQLQYENITNDIVERHLINQSILLLR